MNVHTNSKVIWLALAALVAGGCAGSPAATTPPTAPNQVASPSTPPSEDAPTPLRTEAAAHYTEGVTIQDLPFEWIEDTESISLELLLPQCKTLNLVQRYPAEVSVTAFRGSELDDIVVQDILRTSSEAEAQEFLEQLVRLAETRPPDELGIIEPASGPDLGDASAWFDMIWPDPLAEDPLNSEYTDVWRLVLMRVGESVLQIREKNGVAVVEDAAKAAVANSVGRPSAQSA